MPKDFSDMTAAEKMEALDSPRKADAALDEMHIRVFSLAVERLGQLTRHHEKNGTFPEWVLSNRALRDITALEEFAERYMPYTQPRVKKGEENDEKND